MKTKQEQLKELLGKTFKGTLIQDKILEPYFIIRYAEGGFGVMKTRTDARGNLKFKALCYPSNFMGCLDTIAKEQLHGEGQCYDSIQEYIEAWKKVSTNILNAYKNWDVNSI